MGFREEACTARKRFLAARLGRDRLCFEGFRHQGLPGGRLQGWVFSFSMAGMLQNKKFLVTIQHIDPSTGTVFF